MTAAPELKYRLLCGVAISLFLGSKRLSADTAPVAVSSPTILLSSTTLAAPATTQIVVPVVPSSPSIFIPLPVVLPLTPPVIPKPSVPMAPPATVTLLHPAEGASLPNLSQVWLSGAVTPGATLTVNGLSVSVHPLGAYLTMFSVKPGENVLNLEATTPAHDVARLQRKFTVGDAWKPLPLSGATIDGGSISPGGHVLLQEGDTLRVTARATPQASLQFSLGTFAKAVPMTESLSLGTRLATSTPTAQGLYEGSYIIQPTDKGKDLPIEVSLKMGNKTAKAKSSGQITIDAPGTPRYAVVKDETTAVRTGADGGYDFFLYKGMRVRLTGHVDGLWRIRLSSDQNGWVKESALTELPAGTAPRPATIPNIATVRGEDSTLIRIPVGDQLPYRVEQSFDPMRLTLTIFGAVNHTELVHYDAADRLIREVHWRQISPDTCQLVIEPTFSKWWGYDVRYEGGMLLIEVRKPWTSPDLKGMVIAVDAGHGGADRGALGPHETMEKEANLQIARVVRDALKKAGAKPFLTREKDIDVALYERPKIAWNHNARLFVSIHCNSAGEGENPVIDHGYSVYYYHPQSAALARAVHEQYGKHTALMDHGLYYADFAVCRMTQMPAILVEQAFIIVPDQEQLLFDQAFHRAVANAIVKGIKNFIAKPEP